MVERMASTSLYERAEHATRIIRSRITVEPRVAVVLGSGLGGFADDFEEAVGIPYHDIPGFPRSTVEGHTGRLVGGKVDSVPVLAMQGRVHYYEGYSLEEVTFPIRTFKLLGIKTLVLTNAAGGINVQLTQGALMVLSDHVNLMGDNPLRGPNDERFGPRFPDMTAAYTPSYLEAAHAVAREIDVVLFEGVYMALRGPSYETPAEIRMMRKLGADAVGMSTVPEVIVARHCGMKVLAVSCITNIAAGMSSAQIDHSEVMVVGERAGKQLSELIVRLIPRIVTL